MATSSQDLNRVTSLHKGLGPRLFQCDPRSKGDNPRSNLSSPHGLPLRKRLVVVKCADGQNTNSMFQRRLRERNPPRQQCVGVISTKREAQRGLKQSQQTDVKEVTTTMKGFPPPSFMPRWNPRHKDRTYLNKMFLEDPWSLPPKERMELQRRTGLRLQSISRHYQFKVGSNLPFGKEAIDTKCTCYVNFCDHCKKSHQYRCPLHIHLLDPLQADCKVEVTSHFCRIRKHPENMTLNEIKDPSIYISEVMRRLKAGEISEAPPFPNRFKLDRKLSKKTANILPGQNLLNKTASQIDSFKKALPMTEIKSTQTEPINIDLDLAGDTKDNDCQTKKPEKQAPIMLNVFKSMDHQQPFKPFPINQAKSVQVLSSEIGGYQDYFKKLVENVAKQIIEQSLSEVSRETNLSLLVIQRGNYAQQSSDEKHRHDFRLLQENFRYNLKLQETIDLEVEMAEEANAETLIGAISFAQSCVSTIPTRVLQFIRKCGSGFGDSEVNEDLEGFHSDLMRRTNQEVVRSLASSYLLDDMTAHALRDLELDYLQRQMLDNNQLDTIPELIKALRDVVELRDETFATMKRIMAYLEKKDWDFSGSTTTRTSSSDDDSLNMFVDDVRVSVDSAGNPQYLMDSQGRKLPISVKWTPHIIFGETEGSRIFHLIFDERSSMDEQELEVEGKQARVSEDVHPDNDDETDEYDDDDRDNY